MIQEGTGELLVDTIASDMAIQSMSGAMAVVPLVIFALAYLFFAFCQYTLSKKMGIENSWFAFVPVLNVFNFAQIAGRPMWEWILMLIPFVNLFWIIFAFHNISKRTGYGILMTIWLIFLYIIIFPILAFSYQWRD